MGIGAPHMYFAPRRKGSYFPPHLSTLQTPFYVRAFCFVWQPASHLFRNGEPPKTSTTPAPRPTASFFVLCWPLRPYPVRFRPRVGNCHILQLLRRGRSSSCFPTTFRSATNARGHIRPCARSRRSDPEFNFGLRVTRRKGRGVETTCPPFAPCGCIAR